MTAIVKIGTRGSPLALAQAKILMESLKAHHPELREDGAMETVIIVTSGDRIQDRSLSESGGKGLFTKEIEEALLSGQIDCAVHSMKDMPTVLPEGLVIPCFLPREDVRDAFFSKKAKTLDDLPKGAIVGTSSLRRQAIILARRPDLKIVLFRGNVGTRLKKLEDGVVDATLLAAAGMNRLGMGHLVENILEPEIMLPAVAQGAVGIEVRDNDARMKKYLSAIHCSVTELRVTAERAFLGVMDGSCKTPLGALMSVPDKNNDATFDVLVARPDGTDVRKASYADKIKTVDDARRLGEKAGRELKSKLPDGYFKQASGFTLVEMGLVLVIVGMLLGGVLKWNMLVENTKITATVAQINAIDAAATAFYSTYKAMPGDLPDADKRIPGCNASCALPAGTTGDKKVGYKYWNLRDFQGPLLGGVAPAGSTLAAAAAAAQVIADAAVAAATTAQATASTAQAAAAAAQTALTNAQTAVTTANTALTTANTDSANAQTALTTATTAQTGAQTAATAAAATAATDAATATAAQTALTTAQAAATAAAATATADQTAATAAAATATADQAAAASAQTASTNAANASTNATTAATAIATAHTDIVTAGTSVNTWAAAAYGTYVTTPLLNSGTTLPNTLGTTITTLLSALQTTDLAALNAISPVSTGTQTAITALTANNTSGGALTLTINYLKAIYDPASPTTGPWVVYLNKLALCGASCQAGTSGTALARSNLSTALINLHAAINMANSFINIGINPATGNQIVPAVDATSTATYTFMCDMDINLANIPCGLTAAAALAGFNAGTLICDYGVGAQQCNATDTTVYDFGQHQNYSEAGLVAQNAIAPAQSAASAAAAVFTAANATATASAAASTTAAATAAASAAASTAAAATAATAQTTYNTAAATATASATAATTAAGNLTAANTALTTAQNNVTTTAAAVTTATSNLTAANTALTTAQSNATSTAATSTTATAASDAATATATTAAATAAAAQAAANAAGAGNTPAAAAETLLFWHELRQAGMFGGVTDEAISAGEPAATFGGAMPAAKVGGGWWVGNYDYYPNPPAATYNAGTSSPNDPIADAVALGKSWAVATDTTSYYPVMGMVYVLVQNAAGNIQVNPGKQPLAPYTAMQLDRKIDDGAPATGWVQAYGVTASCFSGADHHYDELVKPKDCGLIVKGNR